MTIDTFSMGDMNYSVGHEVGNKNCPECWYNEVKTCESCNEGLVHTCFGDENSDGDYWLYYLCDKCGDTSGN